MGLAPPTLMPEVPDRPRRLPLSRRLAIAALSLVLAAAVGPRWLAGWGGAALFEGDPDAQDALARPLAASIVAHGEGPLYSTGDSRFDGQSTLAAYQMTILALGQIVLQHPDKRAEYLPALRAAGDRLADPETLRYATKVYGQHASLGIPRGQGHAYAGYINIALSMLRLVDPETPHAALNDQMTAALSSRLFASPTGLFETYPGETWPPDVAVVAGSIGLHARATGKDLSKEMDAWAERFERCSAHPSGYLYQRLVSGSCKPADAPRGSGTAIASYAIAFAHPALARRLHDALARHGLIEILGLGGLREYASGFHGRGDTNAGPIFLGASVGATGFGLGAARMHGDRELYLSLYRSARLFGVRASAPDGSGFALGGVLGNSLLLAMLTARAP